MIGDAPEISYTQLLLGRVADQLERDKRELQQEIKKLREENRKLKQRLTTSPVDTVYEIYLNGYFLSCYHAWLDLPQAEVEVKEIFARAEVEADVHLELEAEVVEEEIE